MKRISSWVAVALAIALLGLARPARADREERAQALFESATGLFQKGEYERAARRFMRAFRIVPHADTAFNAALSWDAANEPARAANAFRLALDGGLPHKARKRAEARLEQLRDKLGRVRVEAPDGSKVLVGDEKRTAPTLLYVEPGVHDVMVVLPDGTRRVRRIHAHEGGLDHVTIEGAGDKSSDTLRTVGWASLIGAGVLGGVSIALEARATTLRNDFNHSSRTDAKLRDAAVHGQMWATVGWVATGAAAVTGVALVLGTGSGPKTHVAIVPGGLSVSRAF